MQTSLLLLPILIFVSGSLLIAQDKVSPIDQYLDSAKTIIVAKCLDVGPVNILLKANVEVEIIHVVKGREERQEISVLSQFGMTPGKYYLLSTKNESTEKFKYFTTETRDSVIQIGSPDEAQQLIALSPKIAVLRTMNLRIDRLGWEIQNLTSELESLKRARKEN